MKSFLPVLLFAAVMALSCTEKTGSFATECEILADAGDWDGLIELSEKKPYDFVAANWCNLALARKGLLVSTLFDRPQKGPQGLIYMPEDHAGDVRLAHVLYAMGNMAAAQNQAFNSLFLDDGSLRPDMLWMLARIELMRGSYGVAEKYLAKLESFRKYRDRARQARVFLWNDEAVLADPELGRGRRDFPKEETFVLVSPMDDLRRILEANPSDSLAMQYALAYLLLSKDMAAHCEFVSRFYGSPALEILPLPSQEALLFYSEYNTNVNGDSSVDAQWCRDHGVLEETFARFADFQQASLKSGGKAPARFRGSFWYYLIYTEI